MFNNLKIGAKLGLSFGSLLILLVIVGALGIRNLHNSNEILKDIVGDNNLKMELANDLIDAVNAVSRDIQTIVLLDETDAMKTIKEKMDQARATYDKTWLALEKMPASEKGRAIRAKIKAGAEETRPINNKIVELAFANKDKEARDLILTTAATAIKKWSDAIYENLEFQKANNEKQAAEAEASYQSAFFWMTAIGIASILFGIIATLVVTRSISRPVGQMQTLLQEVERNGDFSRKLDYKSNDEVGQTAAAFNNMMTALQAVIGDVGHVMDGVAQGNLALRVKADARGDLAKLKDNINLSLESQQVVLSDVNAVMTGVAQGNLTGRVRVDARGELSKLKDSINTSMETLCAAMRTIAANTRQVATASGQTSTAIGQISDGAQNQMHAMSQVVTAVKQTAISVTDVSNNTEQASHKAQESVAIVREGKIKMDRMVDVVNSIASNSEKINKITEVIEKIANKTNLLSLNAAIEAARAGEHGKGFAVVAEEVGKLAANSAQSTQEIAVLVQQAVSEANRAVATVKEVSADMARIEEGSVMTDAMLKRIAVTMEQQSAAVQEINANATNLNKIAEANASASEEITATVVELSKIADGTRQAVEKFHV